MFKVNNNFLLLSLLLSALSIKSTNPLCCAYLLAIMLCVCCVLLNGWSGGMGTEFRHIRQINDTPQLDRRQSTSRHYATQYTRIPCVDVEFEFFSFPSSSSTIPSQMRVWCARIRIPHAYIFVERVRCVYIHNSHKHLRSTIKSYRTNWKMLAHKLVLLLYRELMTVFWMCASRIVVHRLLTKDPSKLRNACVYVRVHVFALREWRQRISSVRNIFIRCVSFRVSAMNGASLVYSIAFVFV